MNGHERPRCGPTTEGWRCGILSQARKTVAARKNIAHHPRVFACPRLPLCLALLFAAWPARFAAACASCALGDPTLTAMGTEQPYVNRLRASLELRHRVDEIGEGGAGLRLTEQRLDSQLAWAPHPRVFLLGTFPLLRREVSYADVLHRRTWGPGDIELRAKVFVYRDREFALRHLVAALVGVKLPTAALEKSPAGQTLPIEVQPGTGSVDPIIGASYGFFSMPWSVYASTQAVVSTTGTNGFRASRSLRSTVALQRQLGTLTALRLAADTRLDGKERERDAESPDSGGFIAFAAPPAPTTSDGCLRAPARTSAPRPGRRGPR